MLRVTVRGGKFLSGVAMYGAGPSNSGGVGHVRFGEKTMRQAILSNEQLQQPASVRVILGDDRPLPVLEIDRSLEILQSIFFKQRCVLLTERAPELSIRAAGGVILSDEKLLDVL